jgi:drug/metabolite transporter (DMT)-like permease
MKYWPLALFAIVSAVRDVWARDLFLGKRIDPIALTFLFCLSTFVILTAVTSLKARKLYRFEDVRAFSREDKIALGLANFGTAVALITTFLSVEQLDVYTHSIADYGMTPIVAVLLGVYLEGRQFSRSSLFGISLSLMALCGLLAQVMPKGGSQTTWMGLVFAVVSCMAACLTRFWSKRLATSGVARERAALTLLPMTITVLGLWLILRPDGWGSLELPLWQLTTLSLGGIALPTYLIVVSFERHSPRSTAWAYSLAPVATFFASAAVGQTSWSWLALGFGMTVLLGVYWSENPPQRVVRILGHSAHSPHVKTNTKGAAAPVSSSHGAPLPLRRPQRKQVPRASHRECLEDFHARTAHRRGRRATNSRAESGAWIAP